MRARHAGEEYVDRRVVSDEATQRYTVEGLAGAFAAAAYSKHPRSGETWVAKQTKPQTCLRNQSEDSTSLACGRSYQEEGKEP